MPPDMRKSFAIVIVAAVLLLGGGTYWLTRPDVARLSIDAVTGRRPEIPKPRFQSIPTVNIASPKGWDNGATPKAADGLRVQRFADGLDHPRWLYRLPDGAVLVAETNAPKRTGWNLVGWVTDLFRAHAGAGGASADRITLLRDTNGDGRADVRSPYLTGLHSPFGMAVIGDWLYVANTDALVRYPYRPGATRITAAPQKLLDLPSGGEHWTRNIVAAPDGRSLYIAIGSATNIADQGPDAEGPLYSARSAHALIRAANQLNRAAILRFTPDARRGERRIETMAWGMRNPVGMAIEPNTERLWAVVNERDMMGSDTPPDYLTLVDGGAFYGWPWFYWGGYPDPRVTPGRPDIQEYAKRPDYALGPHTAPLGLVFAEEARLGARFANGAFVALHGSWNRVPASGYKLVFVPFDTNGFPRRDARPVDVLTGFLTDDGKAQGRPVGVITDARGALLVADDVGNVIWRVQATQQIPDAR